MSSGSNATLHVSRFLEGVTAEEEMERHVERLALACDIDRAQRILDFGPPSAAGSPGSGEVENSPFIGRQKEDVRDSWTVWHNNQWVQGGTRGTWSLWRLLGDRDCDGVTDCLTSRSEEETGVNLQEQGGGPFNSIQISQSCTMDIRLA